MARAARLNAAGPARRPPALLLILVAVLAAHALVLYWLMNARAPASLVRPLAMPMFTRLLQPSTPVVVAAAPAPPPPVRRRPVARQVTPSTPAGGTRTVAPPEVAALPETAAASPADASTSESAAGATAAALDGEGQPPAADTATGAGSSGVEGEAAVRAAAVPPAAAGATAEGTGVAAGAPAESSPPAPPAAPPSDSWPGDTRLSYELSGRFRSGDLYGSARVQWQREGTRYQTSVEIDLPPWINQVLTSQGEVGPDSLRPEVYEETRRGRSRGVRLGEETIALGNGERIARPQGVQDTASQFVELSHRFATGRERLEVGNSVSLWLVRPGGMDLWTYDIVKRETLKTAQLGEIEAFHLKPRPLARPRGNITAEMWFAPSLQFLPVRIRVTMGEEAEVDLLVNTIEQR